jgi:glycosyltransferase involved in cell wall biosynthesis
MGVTTSVIIPVRNGERFIAEAIASVLPQIEHTDEVLVVDDGSTDRTRAAVQQAHDPRVRIIPGLAKGVSSARNIGIEHAAGEFICFLDHDDAWPAGRHEILLGFLRGNPEYDAVYGRIHVVVEADAPPIPQPDRLDGNYLFSLIGTAIYRAQLIQRTGRFAEDMHQGEDNDFVLRLQESGMRFHRADLVSLLYRRHHGNASSGDVTARDGISETIIRKLRRARERGSEQ